jgi:hypothetical protein
MLTRHVTILAKKGNLRTRGDRTSSDRVSARLPFLRQIGCSADGAGRIPGATLEREHIGSPRIRPILVGPTL